MSVVPHGGNSHAASDFTRLFDLPPARHAQEDLIKLGQLMILVRDPNDPKDGADDEENPFVPAGYTYLGQFVDHDLTFDTVTDLSDLNSFAFATDLRTPRFDLDNVYGAGPDDQPYLYEHDNTGAMTGRMLLGTPLANGVPDLARNAEGRAVIGDPRNDENVIVAQIQSAFIRFHNALVDRVIAGNGVPKRTGRDAFNWAQTEVRHHYQRILLDDFLPRIVDTQLLSVKPIYDALKKGKLPRLKYFNAPDGQALMPLEFAVAAYRFGHSMIRAGYRLNPGAIRSIFAGETEGLRGFQKLDPDLWIDWSLFFHSTLPAGIALDANGRASNDQKNGDPLPDGKGTRPPFGRTQFSYKIDPMLVDPLSNLPTVVAGGILPDDPRPALLHNLAIRNLLRGVDYGLPSGEAIADLIGVKQLQDSDLTIRTAASSNSFKVADRAPISANIPAFAGNTPLWFYILAEAEKQVLDAFTSDSDIDPKTVGTQFGPVGATIITETFVGLMLADKESILNLSAQWRSSITGGATFTMVELLTFIGAL